MQRYTEDSLGARRSGWLATGGLVFAFGITLVLFGVLSMMQKTGDQGEKLSASIKFALPEAPPEAPKPPPPPKQVEKAPAPKPKRKAKADTAPKPLVQRLRRPVRAPRGGVPRKIIGGIGMAPAASFDFGDSGTVDATRFSGEAMGNFNTLLQRAAQERARQADRLRGGPGGGVRRRGVRAAQPIETPFPAEEYPSDMLNAGVECMAVTRVVVSKEGLVLEVEVLDVKPHPGRDITEADLEKWRGKVETTLERVSRMWRFRAAVDRSSDLPIEDDVTVNILFEISA